MASAREFTAIAGLTGDHSQDCDGKGNWETSQTNLRDGEKKANDCK